MSKQVLVLVGTKNGGFILQSDAQRNQWQVCGPFCNVPIRDMKYDPASGAIYAAGARMISENDFVAGVWKSPDLGKTWTHSAEGITYGEGEPKVGKIWHLMPAANGVVYAGADPAGLFRSDDGGQNWTHVSGLRAHPTRPDWGGGNGGLCLSSIITDPNDPNQLWVGMSAVGVWHTADGGRTWETRNGGVTNDYVPGETYYSFCCHKMDRAAGDETVLYMQDHGGAYRSFDGGQNWDNITAGLPSDFGFACAAHPHDPRSCYMIPIQGEGRYMPGGQAAVWRANDYGNSWTRLARGLPQEHAYVSVLREGLAVDTLDRHGVYFGTNNGSVWASNDEGENWRTIASNLPYVWSVNTAVIDA